MTKTRKNLLAVLATLFVAVLALCCVMGFAACGETTEDKTPVDYGYTSNFLTGSLQNVDATYVTYTNPDADDESTAKFDGSSISVEYASEAKTYTVNGTAAKMTEDQLKAFWGQTEYVNHTGAQYITISFVANAGESFTIKTSKSPNGIQIDGSSSDKDDTFYTLFYDVTNWSDTNKGETVFTITDANEGTYSVVIGTITLVTSADATE